MAVKSKCDICLCFISAFYNSLNIISRGLKIIFVQIESVTHEVRSRTGFSTCVVTHVLKCFGILSVSGCLSFRLGRPLVCL